jgi:predicted AlkP superfamily pyrophosphatase or phosphodiesterase
MSRRSILIVGAVLAAFGCVAWAAPPNHVIVIGVDGLSPDGVHKADTPNLDRMMREGAFTLHARAVFPTSSSSNWASIVMGAGPEQHGVHSNDWRVDQFILAPTATGTDGFFPTMFDLLRRRHPDAVSGVFHDWDGFGNLFAHRDVDRVVDGDGPEATAKEAIAYLDRAAPHLLFIHFDHVDHAGHEMGWNSPEYYAAVAEADTYIGLVLSALNDGPLRESAYVIVTSDHGGTGKRHGGWSMEEFEVPWMIVGPNVRAGHEIAKPVNTYDTAATAMRILGVDVHSAWIARPVDEAFSE